MEQMCVVNHWEVCVVNDRVTLVVTNWTAVLDFGSLLYDFFTMRNDFTTF